MLSYLEKFENLPLDLRKKVSNRQIIEKISLLENRYGLDLVPLIVKVIVKDITWDDLLSHLRNNFSLSDGKAKALKIDLAQEIFFEIADYLGIKELRQMDAKKKEEKFLPKNKDEKRLPAYSHNHEQENVDLVKVKNPSTPSAGLGQGSSGQAGSTPEDGQAGQAPSAGSTPKDGQAGQAPSAGSGQGSDGGDDSDKKGDDLSFFSKEEQQELAEIASSMDGGEEKNKQDEEFNQILDKIIKESDLSFSSQASEDRFRKILLTYLRGVRNKTKTKHALSKDFDKGGLGLGEKVVDDTVLLSDKYKDFKKPKEKKVKEDQDVIQNRKDSLFDFDEDIELGGPDLPLKSYDNSPIEEEEEKKSLNLNKLPNRDLEYDLSALKKGFKDLAEKKEEIKNKEKKEATTSAEDKFEGEYDLGEILRKNIEEDPSAGSGQAPSAGSGQAPSAHSAHSTHSTGSGQATSAGSGQASSTPEDGQAGHNGENKNLDKNVKDQKDSQGDKVKNSEGKSAQGVFGAADESLVGDLGGSVLNFSEEEDEKKQDKKMKRGEEKISGFKKKIDDIKKAPKLLNPISELKYMDLFTFRRLADTPKERVEKIKEKIKNLEKKFFYRKVQGVQAWRQSPVNKIYLNMGNESIVYSKSIDDIIRDRKKNNKDCLDKEEFESIMDLNSDLKYY